ncbi:unnamed protein product, partial [Ascophyllum nodosum]
MFPSALVLRRTKITLMMILWVQRTIGRKKGEGAVLDTALFMSDSKPGRGVSRGGSRAGTNKGKLDSRGQSG